MPTFESLASPVDTNRYRDNDVEAIALYGSQKGSCHPSYKPPRILRPDPPYITSQQILSSSQTSTVYAGNYRATPPPLQVTPQLRIGAINTQERPKKKYLCPDCKRGFSQSQVLGRHIKDMHQLKRSCSHCLSFTFSRGRPYLYRNHLATHHPEVALLEVRQRGSRFATESVKPPVLGAYQDQGVRPLSSSLLVLAMTIRA